MSDSNTNQPKNDARRRVMRINEVMDFTGLSRSGIYSRASEGLFPQSIPLMPGGTSKGWLSDEIEAWLDSCIEARDGGG